MALHICKTVGGGVMWLKSITPVVIWGPEAQAMEFRTKGEAKRAIAVLPGNDQPVGIVGDESDLRFQE